ncbi:hypothetical protein [Marimonas arenosa]|uniref:Uncharacterized protein n=1 Tax=Marimonas arenosa TaxID=1795305 RepID=A0AAE3WB12_9RHOB|nr:hypothetical protein [Marimonas arenosa]MDQ2089666.1 hypothetical protein [Marimonas arenosa]
MLAGAAEASPQQPAGGLRLTFGISSDLRAHDNLDLDPVSAGSTLRFDNRLSFGLESETRRQKLALSVAGTFRTEDAPGTGFSTVIENPSVDLSYALEGANARLSFDASFDRTEVDGFTILEEGEDPGEIDLITDNGTRDSYRATMTFETGLNAPLGFLLELEHRGTRYDGTTDPGLFKRTTNSAKATTKLRFSPRTEGQVMATFARYEAADATSTKRDTRALNFGITHELSETTVIETSLGVRKIDDSVAGVTQGTELSLSLSRILPRGAIALHLNSEQTSAGRHSTVEVERQYVLPAGSITIGLGAMDADGIDPRTIGKLDYSHELPRGRVTVSLSRSFNVSDEAEVQRVTRGALGLGYEITEFSELTFDLDYVDVSDAGTGGIIDRARGQFRAAYQRELARDWTLSLGYERRYLFTSGIGTAWDNAVFVTLDRSVSWFR